LCAELDALKPIEQEQERRLSEYARQLAESKTKYDGLAKRHDELSALNVENYHNAMELARKNEGQNAHLLRLSDSFDRIEAKTGGGLRNIEQTIAALVEACRTRDQLIAGEVAKRERAEYQLQQAIADLRAKGTHHESQQLNGIGALVDARGQESVYQAVRRTILELQETKAKLAAVTRALSG
jgi:hypothetical protein